MTSQTVDRLEVVVVVDNVTDSLSTNPNNVQTEWVGLSQSGRIPVLSGKPTCCAYHGLSLLITVYIGSWNRTLMLFDAGPEGETFLSTADQISEWPDEIPVPESHLQLVEDRIKRHREGSLSSQPAFEVIDRLLQKEK